jgi:PhoH-like ATPase
MTLKAYVLDTNVLIHDPESVFKFEDNIVVISEVVIHELDGLKNSKRGSVSDQARAASRNILKALNDAQLTNKICISYHQDPTGKHNSKSNDEIIILHAMLAAKEIQGIEKAILVTKDTNMKILAHGKVEVQDYTNDYTAEPLKSSDIEEPYLEVILSNNNPESWKVAPDGHNLTCSIDWFNRQYPNTSPYGFLRGAEGPTYKMQIEMALRDGGVKAIPYYQKAQLFGINPRSEKQRIAGYHLNNQDIDFVALEGSAGTGKTLLALAAGLEQVQQRKYNGIVILRSSTGLDKEDDIGFLPGTEEEKMMPWLQGYRDNLEVIVGEEQGTIDHVIEKFNIQFRSMNLVRGRSYQNMYIIVDECQSNTRHQLKSVITRAGEGSKMVLLGNLAQIDSPYLSKDTSGLKHVCKKFLSYNRGAVVVFDKVERSSLAEFAEKNL